MTPPHKQSSGSNEISARAVEPLATTRITAGRWRTIAWGLLLAAAFFTTHVPPPEQPYPHLPSDKLLHFVGFTALGVATIWRLGSRGVKITSKTALTWLIFLVAYGLFDEVTQPIMRRTFEWLDWLTDCGGAVVGTCGAACWYRIRPKLIRVGVL
jgi:VanZ family protein